MVLSTAFKSGLCSMLAASILLEAPFAFATNAPSAAETNAVTADVATQLKRIKGTKTAFCFAVEDGTVKGVNENEPVRPASVMKTLTTYWAVKTLGPNYQYTTHVFVNPETKDVHIAGSKDPFFDKDRLFVLLADLNRKGLTQIHHLTVDKDFWYWPKATEFRYLSTVIPRGGSSKKARRGSKGRAPAGRRRKPHSPRELFFMSEEHTPQTIAGDEPTIKTALEMSFNTAGWSQELRDRYAKSRLMNPDANLPGDVKMKTDSVAFSQANPLVGQPHVFEFEIQSAPLRMYLKEMNIRSSNPNADELFFSLGGKPGFQAFMRSIGMGPQAANVNSGSGVNLSNTNKNRGDTYLSCSTVVQVIHRMDKELEAQHLDLSDVLAVPGNDHGTWEDSSKSLVVKTGTMVEPLPVRNLAGVKETTQGEVYFGIFLDGKNGKTGPLRDVLTKMSRHFRGTVVEERPYKFGPIGTWTHMNLVSQTNQIAKR
jgi:D-alanyl-D-alanine carboxypeptidase